MIYNLLKPSDPVPSTRGFTRHLTVWDNPIGNRPVSFEMLRDMSPSWQSRALDQKANVDWMFVSSYDTDMEPKGWQRTAKVTTWIQADPKTLCPPSRVGNIRPITTLLPGQIKWNIYKDTDTILLRRNWLTLTPAKPGGLAGIELWTRKGMSINTAKTWRQNGLRLGSQIPAKYEIYPTFEPNTCWKTFSNTTYIAPVPSYNNVIEFCNACIPKNCSYPNPERRIWGEQCCSNSCAV
jgi:hypothetical protein